MSRLEAGSGWKASAVTRREWSLSTAAAARHAVGGAYGAGGAAHARPSRTPAVSRLARRKGTARLRREVEEEAGTSALAPTRNGHVAVVWPGFLHK